LHDDLNEYGILDSLALSASRITDFKSHRADPLELKSPADIIRAPRKIEDQ
jgi:hypothetical protein